MARRLFNILIPIIFAWGAMIPSLTSTLASEGQPLVIAVHHDSGAPSPGGESQGPNDSPSICCFVHGSMASSWTMRPEPPRSTATIHRGTFEDGLLTGIARDIFRPPRV